MITTQFQNLDELLEKLLAAHGPITVPFAGGELRIIAAHFPTGTNDVREPCLIGVRLEDGRPAENHLTLLANTTDAALHLGGCEPTVVHRLSIDDLYHMARAMHGLPSWVSLRRCVSYALQSAWRYGVEPDYTSVLRFMQQAVNDGILVRYLSSGELVSYSRWLGLPNRTSMERYFGLALDARINADIESAATGTLVNAA